MLRTQFPHPRISCALCASVYTRSHRVKLTNFINMKWKIIGKQACFYVHIHARSLHMCGVLCLGGTCGSDVLNQFFVILIYFYDRAVYEHVICWKQHEFLCSMNFHTLVARNGCAACGLCASIFIYFIRTI